jgi:hypothetical protein
LSTKEGGVVLRVVGDVEGLHDSFDERMYILSIS